MCEDRFTRAIELASGLKISCDLSSSVEIEIYIWRFRANIFQRLFMLMNHNQSSLFLFLFDRNYTLAVSKNRHTDVFATKASTDQIEKPSKKIYYLCSGERVEYHLAYRKNTFPAHGHTQRQITVGF